MTTEADVIALFTPPGPIPPRIVLGIGDDCAALAPTREPLLVTTDVQIEGVHFRRRWTDPRRIGRKALAVNLSDIAAMGGTPLAWLLDLGIPPATDLGFLREMRAGMLEWEETVGAPLVGGHTFRNEGGLFLAITLLGEAPPQGILTRSGARPGEVLAVSGTLGGAAAALRALEWDEAPSPGALRRLLDPEPRLELGRLLTACGATACMDLSDGLSSDLHRLARASGTGALVRAADIPRHPDAAELALSLHGGEDYELLFTMPADRFASLAPRSPHPVTAIGEILEAREGILLEKEDGTREPLPPLGHDHLRGRP